MATWKIDKSALHVAIARELERQGIDSEASGKMSDAQSATIEAATESIAWALETDFGKGDA